MPVQIFPSTSLGMSEGRPELKEIKADRMPLGYYQDEDVSFVNHDIQLDAGDTFYMFSDGFVDQKGGKDGEEISE